MRHLTVISVLAAAAVTGCYSDMMNTKPEVKGLAGAAPVQTLTSPASGSNATLRPGGLLIVRVASNPTTGYQWQQVAGDPSVVKMVSDGYLADPAPDGVVGSGGVQVLSFEGVAKGKTTLTLSYQRSSEDVAETLNLSIKVIE